MNLAHVLELESQTRLLDRLALLTRFGSNLIAIQGEPGYGKSWLAQRYLEVGAEQKNQSLLLCHPSQDDVQRRVLVLSQIVSDALFNQHDPLLDSLERMLGEEPCDIAIVVDDAQLLSEALIAELWMLVMAAQANPIWNINVLLFTQTGRLSALLSRLSYGQEYKPIELDIEMLSEIEARQFFESLVVRYVDDQAERQVREAFKKVVPIPGEILALGEMKVERRIVIRSIVGSPLNIALVVLVLLLLAAGGYWWMFNQPSPDEQAQRITGAIEQTAIPTLPETPVTGGEPAELTPIDTSVDDRLDLSGAQDDSDALPPAIIADTASVGREDNQQRVVIESGVVDALLEGKPEAVDTQPIDDLVEASVAQVAVDEASEADVPADDQSLEQGGAESALSPVASTETPPQPVVRFSYAREELLALSPRAYTIQLAAMTSLADVQRFLDQHQLGEQARIYPTLRNGSEWFIVTYRDYPTIQAARDAIESLPASLKALSPWAKSVRQVQREIERVK
ncbi:AAA family ATPase [Vibrio sp. CAU 1672]|uniref:SPOR domain-containing protein n=1 Tax=Vibrio sp. CAU 1672 TaxID=3032594 RepID=UPI0023DB3E47|nr:AAA family ATPase [Vibrio sp. CAU 1672]MDF2155673.1 AAA family ATPase [Vibrio sp. CAU 1672]